MAIIHSIPDIMMLNGPNLSLLDLATIAEQNAEHPSATLPKSHSLITKAKMAGRNFARVNLTRPTFDEVKKRNPKYTPELIQAYFSGFDKCRAEIEASGDLNKILINKADAKGFDLAARNRPRPTIDELKTRYPDYNEECIQAFLAGFDRKAAKIIETGSESVAALKHAQRAGANRALNRGVRPTVEELKALYPKYTDEQYEVYFKAFDHEKASLEETGDKKDLIQKATRAGWDAAKKYSVRPTPESLKARNHKGRRYTDEEVQAYLSGFDTKRAARDAKATEQNLDDESIRNQAIINRAQCAAKQAFRKNGKRLTPEKIKNRNKEYTDNDVLIYLSAYDEMRAKMKAKAQSQILNESLPPLIDDEESVQSNSQTQERLIMPQNKTLLHNFSRVTRRNALPDALEKEPLYAVKALSL